MAPCSVVITRYLFKYPRIFVLDLDSTVVGAWHYTRIMSKGENSILLNLKSIIQIKTLILC